MKVSDIMLPLVAALWGLMTLVLDAIKEVNRIRDVVLGTSITDKDHLKLMVYGDWLSMVTTLFCISIAFTIVACGAPSLLDQQAKPPPAIFGRFCKMLGAFGVLVGLWTIVGCAFDYALMATKL